MKTCNKCNKEKEDGEFSFKDKARGTRQAHCKQCHGAYVKEHYSNNKDIYKARARRDYKKVREKLVAYIRAHKIKCERCGEDHPAVLDFHHVDPSTKELTVAQATSRKKVALEVEKCIVLCSNCHRKFHWDERTMGM